MVTLRGHAFLMARIAVEQSPQGPVDVYYSGAGEIIRLLNGRVVGATGTPVQWLDVKLEQVPNWDAASAEYRRRRDVQPNYRFGLTDTVSVQEISAPSRTQFFGPVPAGVTWFVERSSGDGALPNARFAVMRGAETGKVTVIYGEQCLDRALCFSWQRWPTPQG